MKEAYLLDMDGVIYREDHLIPGALDLIEVFRENGIPFLFLTNNSMPTPEDLVVKMRHLGVDGLSARHFYTSAMNTADFLSEYVLCRSLFGQAVVMWNPGRDGKPADAGSPKGRKMRAASEGLAKIMQ